VTWSGQRSREPRFGAIKTTDALLALRVIADQADALEAYIRARTH
jgi:hypothetical protein